MVLYKCKRCGWATKIKTHYKNHLNRKKICKPINSDISIETLKEEFYKNTLGYAENTLEYAEKPENIKKNTLRYAENTLGYAENTLEYAENTLGYAENTLEYKKKYVANSSCEIRCTKCLKKFKKKRYLTQHINRGNCKGKSNVNINNDTISNEEKTIVNNIKNELDDNKSNDLLKLIIEQHEKEKNEWKKERELMRKEISKLVEKVGDTYNSFNQQNIYINNLGQENLDYLTQDYLGKLLNLPYSAIPKLIKNIHFNPKHPENHNVRITNKKLPYAQVYKNNEWVISDKKEVIENIVDNGFNIIDSFYNEKSDNLDKNKKYNFKGFQDKYDTKEKNLLKKLNKDTELVLINNSK